MFNHNLRRTLAAIIVVLAVVGAALFAIEAASADEGTPTCVPSPAIPAVPGTPEIPAVPEVPAVTETVVVPGTPDFWWNWSPNKDQGPFEGPPAFPVDSRGTWQGPHANGGPSQDTYGTFQQGNGNGSWFHREQGTPETTTTVVVTPAIPGVPAVPATPGTPAVPAVVCPETPPTEEPPVVVDPPVVVETPVVTPETPTETPEEPKDVEVVKCINGVFTTTLNGEVVSESGTCDEKTRTTTVVKSEIQEEGL